MVRLEFGYFHIFYLGRPYGNILKIIYSLSCKSEVCDNINSKPLGHYYLNVLRNVARKYLGLCLISLFWIDAA